MAYSSLVRRSLAENDLTVCSIFVNPAQFAPHEDLASYPRTLPADLAALSALEVKGRTPAAVFVPNALEMYPSGISQDPAHQRGIFVEVMGYGQEMEGRKQDLRARVRQCHRRRRCLHSQLRVPAWAEVSAGARTTTRGQQSRGGCDGRMRRARGAGAKRSRCGDSRGARQVAS